jgi:hypothetical protein
MEFLKTFADDAVLIEPFSGKPQTHNGLKAIEASFRTTWQYQPMPNFRILMGQVEVAGERVRAEWSCTWDGLGGSMKGVDHFEVRGGKIARMEIVVTDAPGAR